MDLTDDILKEKLSKKDYRQLRHLNRKFGFPGYWQETKTDEFFKNLEKIRVSYKNLKIGKPLQGIEGMIKIRDLYYKVTLDSKDILEHWNNAFKDQQEIRNHQKNMVNPPKKDNGDRRVGSGYYHGNKIRYPKKVRKTAWKRFYRLFPELNPSDKNED